PRSGEESRNKIVRSFDRPVKDVRMTFNNLAYKLRLVSEKKKADMNKATVEAYNAKIETKKESAKTNKKAIKRMHKNASAQKAVMKSSDKSRLHDVPVKAKG
ncbi:hypothetical protein, partial [Fulvivirga aurantia]|uniref:hypothetical protein n=1 Tax=Fulvivirga aurantia TaxID=2529383 RepID=UPI00162975F0